MNNVGTTHGECPISNVQVPRNSQISMTQYGLGHYWALVIPAGLGHFSLLVAPLEYPRILSVLLELLELGFVFFQHLGVLGVGGEVNGFVGVGADVE